MYLIEDNASPHAKAKRFTTQLRAEYRGLVRVVKWPPHSPNLNRIERIWDHLKDYFEEAAAHQYTRTLPRAYIIATIVTKWRELSQRIIDREARQFKRKLELTIENQGNNNFYG